MKLVNPARILAIEDNPADLILLRHALDQLGEAYEIEVLVDGEAALKFVEEHRTGAREPDPCIIVLDLHLPKYDGLDVLRAIKRAPVLAHIHVVVLSGLVSSSEESAILALGGISRQKPSRLSEFLPLVAEMMELCKSAAPA